MNCKVCGEEFTKIDERKVNYTSSMGAYAHKMCPGTKCAICNQVIESYAEAIHVPCSMTWKHETCLGHNHNLAPVAKINSRSWIVRS